MRCSAFIWLFCGPVYSSNCLRCFASLLSLSCILCLLWIQNKKLGFYKFFRNNLNQHPVAANKTLIKICNGHIIGPDRIIPNGSLLVREGLIAEIADHDLEIPGAMILDAGGNYISPGFIDIHVHGGGGHDFMDNTSGCFFRNRQIACEVRHHSFVSSLLTGSTEDIIKTLETYELAAPYNELGAQFMGMHLEGPYFAMNQRGAQDPRWIRDPDPAEYEYIVSRSKSIKRWSAAPELKGAIPFARFIKSKGILPALAHTDAIYEEVMEAFENGYTLATHLYSGMSGVTRRNAYRYAGVIESAFLIDEMNVEIIADGAHFPAPLLKLVFKIKGPDRIALSSPMPYVQQVCRRETVLSVICLGTKK